MQELKTKGRVLKREHDGYFISLFFILFLAGFTTTFFHASASTYGSNFLDLGTCSSKSDAGAGYTCDKAVDGNLSTAWNSGDTANFPQWWKVDFGTSTRIINKFSFYQIGANNMKDFIITGSNDDSTYTEILRGTTADSGPQWLDFYSTSTVNYQYVNFEFINRWGGYTNYMTSNEMEVATCLDCDTPTSTATSTTTISDLDKSKTNLFTQLFFLIYGISFGFVLWLCWKGVKKLLHLR